MGRALPLLVDFCSEWAFGGSSDRLNSFVGLLTGEVKGSDERRKAFGST